MSCMQKYERPEEQPILGRDLIVDGPTLVAEEVEIATEEIEENYKSNLETDNNKSDVEMLEEKSQDTNNEIVKNSKKFNESDYKNGSKFENYCWSQSLKDVELTVLLPSTIKLGKHIKVDFKSNHITIKSLIPNQEILLDGDTWDKYRHNDVVWTITDGKLLISFGKHMHTCIVGKLNILEYF